MGEVVGLCRVRLVRLDQVVRGKVMLAQVRLGEIRLSVERSC